MMTGRWIALVGACTLALSSTPAWADTRVRSGEHATFTRLVLYLPTAAQGWRTERIDDGYRIDLDPSPTALDTSGIFDFIPRTRIRDVRLVDGSVLIDSGCDCHVSVFAARPDAIAIDVRDGPDLSADAVPPRDDARQAKQRTVALPARPALNADAAADVPSIVRFEPPLARATPQQVALSSAVARAATGGLLNPREDGVRLDGPGIETRTATDPPARERNSEVEAQLCAELATLDQIVSIDRETAWRRIEAPDPSGTELVERALAYLSLGFGAEAAADFAASSLPTATALALGAAANAIDTPSGMDNPQGLEDAQACAGLPGLLGMIAAPRGDAVHVSEAVGRRGVATLSRLPPPLRSHLAPHLERRLADSGLHDLAQAARFSRQRITPDTAAQTRAGTGDDLQEDNGGLPPLPDTVFFDTELTETVRGVIAAGRFAQEDLVLIEAWIQEAPTVAEADSASRFYVGALNRAGRPLDALAHLDARIGRRGVMRPAIAAAASESVEAATRFVDGGALLVLDARLPQRPWYDRLPQAVRDTFRQRVDAVRLRVLGDTDDGPPRSAEVGRPDSTGSRAFGTAADTGQGAPGNAPAAEAVSPARRAADAAIKAAGASVASSARLRETAADVTASWTEASQARRSSAGTQAARP